jgi:hypothetical protein
MPQERKAGPSTTLAALRFGRDDNSSYLGMLFSDAARQTNGDFNPALPEKLYPQKFEYPALLLRRAYDRLSGRGPGPTSRRRGC